MKTQINPKWLNQKFLLNLKIFKTSINQQNLRFNNQLQNQSVWFSTTLRFYTHCQSPGLHICYRVACLVNQSQQYNKNCLLLYGTISSPISTVWQVKNTAPVATQQHEHLMMSNHLHGKCTAIKFHSKHMWNGVICSFISVKATGCLKQFQTEFLNIYGWIPAAF